MPDDHRVYLDGQWISGDSLHEIERIERELREAEFELVRMRDEFALKREAQFEKEWQRSHGR